MADEKFSELDPITDLDAFDLIPVVDISVPQTKTITRALLKSDLVTDDANEFLKNQNIASSSCLIVAGNVELNFITNGNAKLTLTEDVTLIAPIWIGDGRAIMLKVMQDATGGRALSFNTIFDFAGTDAAVNDVASAVTYYYFWSDGTKVFARKIWEDD